MKHNASEAKLVASSQEINFQLAGEATTPDEPQAAASAFDSAPEYGAELRTVEASSTAIVVPTPAITSVGEASELEAPRWPTGTEGGAILWRWTPILLRFTSVAVVVQAIGFAAGILVVRNLPKQEYAFYTLCNTMLATVLVLADGGISSALTAIGGQVWQDRGRLSQLIRTALQLRRQMAAAAVPVVIALLVWLLHRNGATAGKIAVLLAIVLAGCGLELVTRIYVVALRLNSEIRQIQKQSLVGVLLKLSLIAVAVTLWFNVEIAILAVVAGFAVQYWMLRSWSRKHLNVDAAPDAEMRSEIVAVVRRQAPHSIYYCVQAQITVWLISIFGNAERVADVGALGRLAVVFSILSSVLSEVLYPAFARTRGPVLVRRRYLQIVISCAALSGSLIVLTALFPAQVLSLLGARYSGLHREGILMAISSVLTTLAGVAWNLNTTRAWIVPPARYIPAAIALQVVLISLLNLSTVQGVLLLSIFTAIPDVAWGIGTALYRTRKWELEQAAGTARA